MRGDQQLSQDETRQIVVLFKGEVVLLDRDIHDADVANEVTSPVHPRVAIVWHQANVDQR